VWRSIAARYKNEPTIWGYDLINEPVPQDGREYELLPSLITMRNAIREVDNNHIIVAEGSWWASDLQKIDWTDPVTQQETGINKAWDNNLVYQTHHYGPAAGTFNRDEMTDRMGIPLILGEYGETDNGNLKRMTDWAKADTAGYFPWSFKKMSHDKTLWTIPPNATYNTFKDVVKKGGKGPDNLYQGMIAFAKNNIKNGHSSLQWHKGFYDATKPANANNNGPIDPVDPVTPPVKPPQPPTPTTPEPTCKDATPKDVNVSALNVPTLVEAENYCAMQGVQTQNTSDTDGGENIGWIDVGDWVEYKLDITKPGEYQFDLRLATNGSKGAFDLMIDGEKVESITLANTGGWQSWITESVAVEMSRGVHIVRLNFTGEDLNVNWLKLKYVQDMSSNSPNDIASGRYAIINSRSGKAADAADWSTQNGGNIQQWTYQQQANQQWDIVEFKNGIYEIKNAHSGLCLDAQNGSNNVQQWQCFKNKNQLWLIDTNKKGESVIRLTNRKRFLSINNKSKSNRGNLITNTSKTKWKLNTIK